MVGTPIAKSPKYANISYSKYEANINPNVISVCLINLFFSRGTPNRKFEIIISKM
jgi:hypothetical protein